MVYGLNWRFSQFSVLIQQNQHRNDYAMNTEKKGSFLLLCSIVATAILVALAVLPNDPLLLNEESVPIAYGDNLTFRPGLPQLGLYNQGSYETGPVEIVEDTWRPITDIVIEKPLHRADIAAPEAWNIRTDGSAKIVCVIDTGFDLEDPDLQPNLWVNDREIPGDGIDNDGNGVVDDVHGIAVSADGSLITGSMSDGRGHGTAIAGIIGAVGNNGIGGVGVCWKAQIMCLRAERLADASLIRSLRYALENGASIVNCSWGTRKSSSVALRNAFEELRVAGVICVFSAGNMKSSSDELDIDKVPRFPASWVKDGLDNGIVVTSTTPEDVLFPYAYYGKDTVHLAAPGKFISSMGEYHTGTSFAGPFVTGSVALVWSEHPEWSYKEVIACLLKTVDPLPSLDGKCLTGGRLNLFKALAYGKEVAPPVLSIKNVGDGRLEVYVASSPYDSNQYVVESSSDIVTWKEIGAIDPVKKTSVSVDAVLSDSGYFRVRSR